MDVFEFISAYQWPGSYQKISIFQDHVENQWSIFWFSFFKREFRIEDIEKVSTFLNAIIVKTSKDTFKFPAQGNLQKDIIAFLKKEISFTDFQERTK